MIGFVDLGDIYTNFATLKCVEKLASHVLVFLVKSIANPWSYSFATFGTNGVTVFQIMPTFWKVICCLEKINLKVMAATADRASPNRKFFKMHKLLDGNAGTDVVYRTKNIQIQENRFLFSRHSTSD